MTELGHDIDEAILLRLQANDLIPCKSVCKSWNSLISSDRFVKSHLNRQHSNESRETRISVPRRCCRLHGTYRLVGSSNGLVCISCYDYHVFFVFNPSTREVKELINLPDYAGCDYVSGFGYDSSIDDFKVVIGSRELPNDDPVFHVLELKKNIWRWIDEEWDDDYDYDYLEGEGILCNGALHWLHRDIHDRTRFEIVSLDLSKEVLKKTPLPKLDDKWNLGTMKDRLCVFRFPKTDLKENDDIIEIWVMRNDQVNWERKLLPPGYDANKTTMRDQMNWECQLLPPRYDADKTTMRDQKNWEWKLQPPGYDANKTMMDYVPRRNFLSGHVHIWLLEEGSAAPVLLRSIDPFHDKHFLYNYDEHIQLSTYSECSYNYDEHVFVKSLESPHGMGNENGRSESPVSHNSDGGRAKKTKQSVLFDDADSDDDGRSVSSDSDDDGRSVSTDYDDDGRSVSSDSDDDGRRCERKSRES